MSDILARVALAGLLLLWEQLRDAWPVIVAALKGRKLAVLGARGVGKTQLIHFLTAGSLPQRATQTVVPEKTPHGRLQLRELELVLKESTDVPGDKSAYAQWKGLVEDSDLVLYLLRADRLLAGDRDVEDRVRNDLRHVGSWLAARKARPTFMLVGTHCDLDPASSGYTLERWGDYLDRFRSLPVVAELVAHAGGWQQVRVVLGSLRTAADAEFLAYHILRPET